MRGRLPEVAIAMSSAVCRRPRLEHGIHRRSETDPIQDEDSSEAGSDGCQGAQSSIVIQAEALRSLALSVMAWRSHHSKGTLHVACYHPLHRLQAHSNTT